jgi:hypothetical protein
MVLDIVVDLVWVPLLRASMDGSTDDRKENRLGPLFRVARLLRVTRVTRLIRIIPEFITLLKGLFAAVRSVMVTIILLIVFVYLFAVIFRIQVRCTGHDNCSNFKKLQKDYFGGIGQSMFTLFFQGTLLDNVSRLANDIWKPMPWDHGPHGYSPSDDEEVPEMERSARDISLFLLFMTYLFLTNFAVLNMLIGIICGVVSEVTKDENDRNNREKLSRQLLDIMDVYDRDGSGKLGMDEFNLFIRNPEVKRVLDNFEADYLGIQEEISAWDQFREEGEDEDNDGASGIEFSKIISLVLRMRRGGSLAVSDMVSLRRFTGEKIKKLEHKVEFEHKVSRRGRL